VMTWLHVIVMRVVVLHVVVIRGVRCLALIHSACLPRGSEEQGHGQGSAQNLPPHKELPWDVKLQDRCQLGGCFIQRFGATTRPDR
jgi:hypothetical protein